MRQKHDRYEIDDDPRRVDAKRVHAWLATTYWSPGVSMEVVQRGLRGTSLVVGAYDAGQQVGIMRVISDKATFAWIADVFVDEAHRRRGIAGAMLRFTLGHPEFQGLRRWVLATKDAHKVYESVGFKPLPNPERWMILKQEDAADNARAPG
jgi:GNAT superfamily N-acetyltransferase